MGRGLWTCGRRSKGYLFRCCARPSPASRHGATATTHHHLTLLAAQSTHTTTLTVLGHATLVHARFVQAVT
jgi:hypothetical protein